MSELERARENLRKQPRVNPGSSKQSVNHGHMLYANINLMLALRADREAKEQHRNDDAK